jgi:orotate phosphoribosyltransferase
MQEPELLDLMTELGALLRGHFLLSSGLHSDTYFQCARILQFPELARELGYQIAQRLEQQSVDLVVSPAMGGILIGHEVARAVGRRFVFTERVDGRMTLRRGFEIAKGERAIIAEDVVTRGTSVREVADVIEAAGGVVIGLGAIIDRTGGTADLPVPLQALARVEVTNYPADSCPLCRAGGKPIKPGSRDS